MPRIKLFISTGFTGCGYKDYYDYPDEDWDELTEDDKEKELDQLAQDFLGNHIDFGAYVEG